MDYRFDAQLIEMASRGLEHTDTGVARSPDFRAGWSEEKQTRNPAGGGEMGDPGVVAEVGATGGEAFRKSG